MIRRSLFPQCKIDGVTLETVDFHTRAVTLIFQIDTRQFAVFGEFFHRKINAVFRFVGVTLVEKRLHYLNHFGNVVRCTRANGRTFDVERVDVLHKLVGVKRGNFQGVFARFVSRFLHLVFAVVGIGHKVPYVGDVHNRLHAVAVVFQHTPKLIHKHVSAQVADMRILVHGRSATVHAHLARFDRHKIFLFACKCVVNSKLHSNSPEGAVCGKPHCHAVCLLADSQAQSPTINIFTIFYHKQEQSTSIIVFFFN